MNKMLITIFDTETDAYEGLRALKELHQAGDLTVYATAVIVKDASGKVAVKQTAEDGPFGTGLGMLTGSLIGLLGGPVGAAIGATTGGLAGMLYDLTRLGIDSEFLKEVSTALTPNRAAVLAEVDETWVTPVDVRLSQLGGHVFRRQRSEMVEDMLQREATVIEAELHSLQAELAEAKAENRAALQARIDKAHQDLSALQSRIEAKQAEIQAELTARIDAMHQQVKTASQARKAQTEQRIAEIKVDVEARRAKLDQANKLIKEALGPKVPA